MLARRMKRFEYVEGTSSKFWEVEVAGAKLTTRWGRIGTDGQTKTATLGSPTTAQTAADKQIKEKLAKGYAAAKGGARGAKAASSKPVKAAKTAPAKSSPGPAKSSPAPGKSSPAKPARAKAGGTFSFSAEQDALYAQGWPHLRRLIPGAPKGGPARAIKAELDASDPELLVEVHEEVARGFLHAMAIDRMDKNGRAKAMASSAPIDDAVMTAILERLCPSMSETYEFRIHDTAFLLEAVLGTERVATALVDRFLVAASTRKLWEQTDNAHDHAFHLASALGFMRPRLPPARWKTIIAPLRAAKKASSLFARRLALLIDPKLAVTGTGENMKMLELDILLERDDAKALRAYFTKWTAYWSSARLYYVAGADLLDHDQMAALPRRPAWEQKQFVSHLGTIRHRGAVRVMMWILSGRSAKQEAADWLRKHADFARPILDEIAGGPDAKEAGLAAAAIAALGGKAPAKHKALTPAQVDKEIQGALKGLEKRLIAADGDRTAEAAILKKVFNTYCEVRAAGGDDTPEAYYTHTLAEVPWTVDGDVLERWLQLAVDVG